MKATMLANKLNAIVREYGRDIEVMLMIDASNGDCLGVSGLSDVHAGEDVTETRFLITLSGTEGDHPVTPVHPSPADAEARELEELLVAALEWRRAYLRRDVGEGALRSGEIAGPEFMALMQAENAAQDKLAEIPLDSFRTALRLLAQQPTPATAEGLWLGDKDGLSTAGLNHALSLIPKTHKAQEAEVFCNGEPVTGVSILGKHGQSMGEFQVYLQTEGQACAETDIQIYPPPALATADAEVQP